MFYVDMENLLVFTYAKRYSKRCFATMQLFTNQ